MIAYSFFPAGGFRNLADGAPYRRGFTGDYASSSAYDIPTIWRFGFYDTYINWSATHRTYGLSVRCVAWEGRNYSYFAVLLYL